MLISRWIGQVNGARVGNVFWSENDDGSGEFVIGQPDGGNFLSLKIAGKPNNPTEYGLSIAGGEGVAPQLVGEIKVEVASQGRRAGSWKLNDGSAGTFEVVAKELGAVPPANPLEQSQVQIANKDVPLGAITIYRADLARIIAEMRSYFDEPYLTVIRAKEGEQAIVRSAAEYLARGDLPDKLSEFTIGVEKNVEHGLKKIVNLVLSDNLDSKISVSSPDELWTEAVSQRLDKFMKEFTSPLTGVLAIIYLSEQTRCANRKIDRPALFLKV